MNDLFAFTVISLLLVISPGPNSVLIVKTVSHRGKQAGIENITGLVAATFIHGAISVFGLSAVILQSAQLFLIIKLFGAAYLLYLGIKTIYGTFTGDKKVKNNAAIPDNNRKNTYQNFTEGFLTQILNPKVSLFYLAAFPQFLDLENHNHLDAFVLVGIHATIIFFWFLSMSIGLSKIRSLTKKSTMGEWIQRISGCVLLYFSSVLITQEVRK